MANSRWRTNRPVLGADIAGVVLVNYMHSDLTTDIN
jgi:hypothetical protein